MSPFVSKTIKIFLEFNSISNNILCIIELLSILFNDILFNDVLFKKKLRDELTSKYVS